MDFVEFRNRVIALAEEHGSQRKAALHLNVNSGNFTQVIRYENESKVLRKAMGLPKYPKRRRWCVDVDRETLEMLHEIEEGFESRSGMVKKMAFLYKFYADEFGSKEIGYGSD